MPAEKHVVTGVEPVWVRVKYGWTEKWGAETMNSLEFYDWVDKEDAMYECSCGKSIEGYDAMVEHLDDVNPDRS